jgi:hypothetical protein
MQVLRTVLETILINHLKLRIRLNAATKMNLDDDVGVNDDLVAVFEDRNLTSRVHLEVPTLMLKNRQFRPRCVFNLTAVTILA